MKLLQYSNLLYLSIFNIFLDDNAECHLFLNSDNEIQWNARKKLKHQMVIPIKYCLHVEIIPANMGARQVQDYYNIRFFMYEEALALRHNTVTVGSSAS